MTKKIIYSVLILAVISLLIALKYYQNIYGKNVKQNAELFIKHDATINDVIQDLKPYLKSDKSFKWVAKKMSYSSPKSGRYLLEKGMNNRKLIQKLRIGDQDPVTITFNNQDNLKKLSARLAEQIEPDSTTLYKSFTNSQYLKDKGLSLDNVLSIFIPNSYEVYWNTSADDLRDKMFEEYQKFWNSTRQAKAEKLGLTPQQVMTLASIVQKETSVVSERKRVAGLYLNRLKIGMSLQADPTIIYALKKANGDDFQIKRVLFKHLEIDSPYNTYKNVGLPPTLIAMPDVSSIEAVLNAEDHDYLYMCASTTKLGQHEFAKNLSQHNINAAKYSAWADRQGL